MRFSFLLSLLSIYTNGASGYNRHSVSHAKCAVNTCVCSTTVFGTFSGVITHFDDNEYACSDWNKKAKNAMKKNVLFAATNYKLASTSDPTSKYILPCKEGEYLCARDSRGVEYMLIDWCDKNGVEKCTFHEESHIDILVIKESLATDECTSGCGGYDNFKLPWSLVKCANQISPRDF